MDDSDWLRKYRLLVQAGLDGADAVVAPTRWMADALATHFVLPVEPRVIPNGRSVPGSEADERKLQAVTVGRLWDEAKDVGMLRDVQSPIPLLVAGESGFEQARSTCGREEMTERSAVDVGEGSKMRNPTQPPSALGQLSQRELFALLRQSAIYICTSKYEPFGLAPLEAALCGCAVLARDIPSLHEVWQDAALYFSDALSLSRLLRTLTDDPDLLALTQQRSHRRARQFSAEKMTDSYLQLYFKMAKHEAAAHVS
jgi:glycosyltransferase involved in cell wall biosynthesis